MAAAMLPQFQDGASAPSFFGASGLRAASQAFACVLAVKFAARGWAIRLLVRRTKKAALKRRFFIKRVFFY
jgi:hypothetical protein